MTDIFIEKHLKGGKSMDKHAEQLREILYCAMGLSDEGEEEKIWGWIANEKE